MDEKYLIGIDVLDAQHQEIHEVACEVIEAVETADKWHVVHFVVDRLHELLRFHFAVEESVMSIVGFPEIEDHKKVHQEILKTVERLRVATLTPTTFDELEKAERFSFLSHIQGHDKRFAEYVSANIPNLKR